MAKMQTDSIPTADPESVKLDAPLATAEELGTEIGDWSSWPKKLKASDAKPLRKLVNANCLFWGMPTADVIHQPVIARLTQLKTKPAKKSEDTFDYAEAAQYWCEAILSSAEEPPNVALLVQGIAWAHALPYLTSRLSQDDWLQLLETLLECTTEAASPSAIQRMINEVELPFVLAYALSPVSHCRALRKTSGQRFTTLLDELLDGEGMPHADYLANIQYLLASSVRCMAIDSESKKSRISKAGRLQFDWLTRQALRWARPDGSCTLHASQDSPHFDDMMKCAIRFTDDDSDRAAWKKLRGKRIAAEELGELPEVAEHSEWAELATMRTSWDPKAIRLATTYHNQRIGLELGVGVETILCGESNPRVRVNGELLVAESEWTDVCWESDEDLDYLEIECTLNGGWRVQRQLLLARKDHFVFMADAITGPKHAEIQYQHDLPVVDGIEVEGTEENTECVLLGEKKIGRILPLALPEWKSAAGDDRLRLEPTRLELTANATSLYAPLFICLDPARRNKPLTWRQLTVAEDMLIVSKDVAVAYRVQIGKDQWLIYRSMEKPGNRTFIGLNLISDFYVARFDAEGETKMLIDVEPS